MRKRIFVISLLVMLLATAAYVAAQDDGDKPIPSPQSDDPVERGEYLFRIGFGCMGCHRGPLPDGAISEDPLTADPTGGEPFELPFATVYASNLTLVGEWTADQLETAIRYGVDDEGEGLIPVMPFTLYESMSDQDMGDLIAYVQSLEPMGEDVPELLFADPSMTRDMFLFRGEIDIEAERPAPDPADLVARGAYLANQASCMHCHGQAGPTFEVTPYPAGLPWGFFGPPLLPFFMDTKYASSDEVKTVLTTGTRPDGTMLAPAMPWMVIPLWPESDVDALVAWIDSLPEVDPSENPNPPAAPPAGASLDGATLVEQRCTACHDTARIENATKDETAWTATVDRMIGYGAVLSDEERAALIAYLVSMSMD